MMSIKKSRTVIKSKVITGMESPDLALQNQMTSELDTPVHMKSMNGTKRMQMWPDKEHYGADDHGSANHAQFWIKRETPSNTNGRSQQRPQIAIHNNPGAVVHDTPHTQFNIVLPHQIHGSKNGKGLLPGIERIHIPS